MRDALPCAIAPPPREVHIYAVPSAELRRLVAPRTARAANRQHRLEKPPIVGSRSTVIAFLARQNRFDLIPYVVAQYRSNHPASVAQKTGCEQI
jgi:hypothetical protein